MKDVHRAADHAVGWQDMLSIHGLATHLHGLGARSVAELLIELAGGPAGPASVLGALERYHHLTRQQVVAAGADRPLRPRLMVVS